MSSQENQDAQLQKQDTQVELIIFGTEESNVEKSQSENNNALNDSNSSILNLSSNRYVGLRKEGFERKEDQDESIQSHHSNQANNFNPGAANQVIVRCENQNGHPQQSRMEVKSSIHPAESKRNASSPKESIEDILKKLKKKYNTENIIHAGSGGFGHVFRVEEANGNVFAAKYLIDKFGNDIENEVTLLRKLGSYEFIIKAKNYAASPWKEGDIPIIETPFCEYTLLNYLRKEKIKNIENFPQSLIRLAKEIALAIDYCHQNKVIHRDIAPDNIMITIDGKAQLIDFGLARIERHPELMLRAGKPDYVPLDILETPHYGWDIWSFGVSLLELVSNKSFYKEVKDKGIMSQRLIDESIKKIGVPKEFQLLESVILKCCKAEEKDRISSKELVQLMMAKEITFNLEKFIEDELKKLIKNEDVDDSRNKMYEAIEEYSKEFNFSSKDFSEEIAENQTKGKILQKIKEINYESIKQFFGPKYQTEFDKQFEERQLQSSTYDIETLKDNFFQQIKDDVDNLKDEEKIDQIRDKIKIDVKAQIWEIQKKEIKSCITEELQSMNSKDQKSKLQNYFNDEIDSAKDPEKTLNEVKKIYTLKLNRKIKDIRLKKWFSWITFIIQLILISIWLGVFFSRGRLTEIDTDEFSTITYDGYISFELPDESLCIIAAEKDTLAFKRSLDESSGFYLFSAGEEYISNESLEVQLLVIPAMLCLIGSILLISQSLLSKARKEKLKKIVSFVLFLLLGIADIIVFVLVSQNSSYEIYQQHPDNIGISFNCSTRPLLLAPPIFQLAAVSFYGLSILISERLKKKREAI